MTLYLYFELRLAKLQTSKGRHRGVVWFCKWLPKVIDHSALFLFKPVLANYTDQVSECCKQKEGQPIASTAFDLAVTLLILNLLPSRPAWIFQVGWLTVRTERHFQHRWPALPYTQRVIINEIYNSLEVGWLKSSSVLVWEQHIMSRYILPVRVRQQVSLDISPFIMWCLVRDLL